MKIHKHSRSSVSSAKEAVQDVKQVIERELKEKVWEVARSDNFGFPESDIPSYFYLDTDWYNDHIVRVELRAELSYEGLMELIDRSAVNVHLCQHFGSQLRGLYIF